jgi:2-polyprenyl-6-hydroxyphenyl methylase/3-demethylubiquinone-9 3-methyltransferase
MPRIIFAIATLRIDSVLQNVLIVSSMTATGYNFHNCKLCGQASARPTYALGDATIHVCSQCDFHFIDQLDGPAASMMQSCALNEKARDYIDLRREESAVFHQSRLNLIRDQIDLSHAHCLDIGAGLGQFQLLLAQQGATTEGIEPSAARRAYAQATWGIELNAELVDSSYWQQQRLAAFDLITLWDVLEHVDFPRETLQAAVRLLKPGGLLALDTPSREVPAYRLSQWLYRRSRGRVSLFLPSYYSCARFGHKQIFTRDQLFQLLSGLKLELVCQPESYPAEGKAGKKIIAIGRKGE